jgi:hypothetical protein
MIRDVEVDRPPIVVGKRAAKRSPPGPEGVAMQYVMLIADDGSGTTLPQTEQEAVYAKIGAWWGDLAAKGKIVGGNELQPVSTAKTVRIQGDRVTVTDGPFVESKEVIGGYGVLECDSLDEAVEIAKSWPGRASVLEVRPTVFHGDA